MRTKCPLKDSEIYRFCYSTGLFTRVFREKKFCVEKPCYCLMRLQQPKTTLGFDFCQLRARSMITSYHVAQTHGNWKVFNHLAFFSCPIWVGEPVLMIASDSGFSLIGMRADVEPCCCNPFTSGFWGYCILPASSKQSGHFPFLINKEQFNFGLTLETVVEH